MSIFDAFSDRWQQGNEVVATTNVGESLLGSHHIPEGTKGRVVDTREGLLHDTVTVEFDNGYTEVVKPSELKRRSSWW